MMDFKLKGSVRTQQARATQGVLMLEAFEGDGEEGRNGMDGQPE